MDNKTLFLEDLKNTDFEDDAAFKPLLIRAMVLLGWSEVDVAHQFSASRSTVTRWLNGRNMPHPAMRRAMYNQILELVMIL